MTEDHAASSTAWETCNGGNPASFWLAAALLVAPAMAGELPAVGLVTVVAGLTAPLDLDAPEDGSGRLLITEQTGLVHLLDPERGLIEPPFLDLRHRLRPLEEGFEERGLLGLALHPDFATNGKLFVTYTAPLREGANPGWNHTRRVSELTVHPGDPDRADPDSERVLLEIDWPSRKHIGGGLAFGPDGMLYVGLGDGGGAHGVGQEVLYDAFEVPEHHVHWDALAQDPTSLYGSILRLDVDHGHPGYAIPPTNPFVGREGRDEIFAYGFRNPYRIAFDPAGTPGAFVSATAETLFESIYLVDRPGNYGWAVKEGTRCFDRLSPTAPPAECPQRDALGFSIQDPIVEYGHVRARGEDVVLHEPIESLGTANVGGRIYRGAALPALGGLLVFGDWSRDFREPSGQVLVARPPARFGALWSIERLIELDTRVLSIGQDADGEVWVLTSDSLGPYGDTGAIHRLVPAQ